MSELKIGTAQFAAYRKGREAAEAGTPASSCPYPDRRTDRGSVTFARGFRTAWFEGYKDAQEGKPMRYVGGKLYNPPLPHIEQQAEQGA